MYPGKMPGKWFVIGKSFTNKRGKNYMIKFSPHHLENAKPNTWEDFFFLLLFWKKMDSHHLEIFVFFHSSECYSIYIFRPQRAIVVDDTFMSHLSDSFSWYFTCLLSSICWFWHKANRANQNGIFSSMAWYRTAYLKEFHICFWMSFVLKKKNHSLVCLFSRKRWKKERRKKQ